MQIVGANPACGVYIDRRGSFLDDASLEHGQKGLVLLMCVCRMQFVANFECCMLNRP